jgi:aspartate kinase
MKIIVQKFGGTSVSTPERRERAAQRVVEAIGGGRFPVVVVSAMGREGAPYAPIRSFRCGRRRSSEGSDMLMSCGEIISAVAHGATLRRKGIDAQAVNGRQAGILTDEASGGRSAGRWIPEDSCA